MRHSRVSLVLAAGLTLQLVACGTAAVDSSTTRSGGSGGSSGATGSSGAGAGGRGTGDAGAAGAPGSGGAGAGADGKGGMAGVAGGAGAAGAGAAGAGAAGASGGGGSTGKGGGAGAGGAVDAGGFAGRDGAAGAADGGGRADAGSATDATGPGAGDAGIPFKGVANSACTDLPALGAAWYYNWTLSRGNCTASQFVPMLWGHTGNEQTASGITNALSGLVTAGYTTVLGFNEPDTATQSNMSVAAAIALWPSFNHPSLRVGSPATSANAAGQAWFADFMAQVNADTTGTLRVDFITAHWYGWNAGSCDANAASFESYVRSIEAIPGNRPIWFTEWGCLNQSNPDAATVQAFFSGALRMFARHPRIERYAWYPWTTNNELVLNGGLTALGMVFAAAPAAK